MMRRWIAGAVLVATLLVAAWYVAKALQGDRALEEGVVAFKRGDYEAALPRLMPLAESGNQSAMLLMGIAYAHGHGVIKDRSRAQQLILAADSDGGSEHFFHIAQRFERGEQTEKNSDEAFAWYLLAAERGHRRSQEIVVDAYRTGKFSQEINPSKSAYWEEKLAHQPINH
jgi:TPR repeat protein